MKIANCSSGLVSFTWKSDTDGEKELEDTALE